MLLLSSLSVFIACHIIYLIYLDMCDVTTYVTPIVGSLIVTSHISTFLHFFIYCLPHHLFYLDMCDVTTYVTPTVGSLAIRNRIIYMCLLVRGKRREAGSWLVEPAATGDPRHFVRM